MNRKFSVVFIVFSTLFSGLGYAQQLPSKLEILTKMKSVNDYWISQNASPGNNQWARAVYFAGNVEFYKAYPKDSYLQYANLWAANNGWGLNGGTSTRNADNQTCGQAYIDMYKLDSVKQLNKIAAIKTSIDNMVYSSKSTDWTWIDAIFMSMPVFARLGNLTGDTIYFKRMHDLYLYTKDTLGLYNYNERLWYRDVNYKPPYATKNGQDCYWSRGNGWIVGAHARILELLPANDPHRNEYVQTFQQMAAALKDRQRTDGFWNSSLDDPNEYNGPETSGTAFFTYGIAWGINNHLLDSATYYPVVVKAWNGLTTIAYQPTGLLGYVQGVGAQPGLASAGTTQDFGVGAFLLAGTELLKMASGIMTGPTNFSMKTIDVSDNSHLSVHFTKKLDYASALKAENYIINNGVTVLSVSKGDNDSTAILSVSGLTPGSYQLQVSNISSAQGSQVEPGEKKTFVYTLVTGLTASGFEPGTSNTPDKTLDNDFSTRWSCDGIGQWIMYDLGGIKQVSSVDMSFFNGNVRKSFFSIYLSTNLKDTVQVFNGSTSGRTATLENYDFTDQPARYVKIVGYGNSQSTWNSITETRINSTEITSVLKQEENSEFKIYPNPVKGNSFKIITKNDLLSKVTITDLTGKVIFKKTIQAINSEYKITGLPLTKGIYIVSVTNGEKSGSALLISE
ncbi:MAG: glycoside hydrolase family 88 protein [Paludibacter sp.]|nr:glycoside hydrolase family 88 protein [Paludibacter sp.]